jgi:hypothetical protein
MSGRNKDTSELFESAGLAGRVGGARIPGNYREPGDGVAGSQKGGRRTRFTAPIEK